MSLGVELSGIWLSFAKDGPTKERSWHQVIAGLDLDVAPDSVHALVGPNGCGKSTLLKLIAGVIDTSRGTVRFTGKQRHHNRTALVFQDPTLLPWWTVERNVSIGLELGGREPPLEKPTRKSMLRKVRAFHTEQVGLGEHRTGRPDELSHGMRTRAGIARAFAHDADVVLMDEPFVHLDWISRRRLWEEFETHWQLDPRTYLLVTHDIDEAVLLADRVSVMSPAPSAIVETIEVDLPRPRTMDQISAPGFRSAVSRTWSALDQSNAK